MTKTACIGTPVDIQAANSIEICVQTITVGAIFSFYFQTGIVHSEALIIAIFFASHGVRCRALRGDGWIRISLVIIQI